MKKLFCVLGVLIYCLSCSFSVSADVIWEPQDSFYREHSAECTYVNRQFTANGPDGKVILYKSPEMPIETDTWENGYQVYISFTYTDSDGIEWGVYDGGPCGWMPMAYMEVVYDSISFKEDHGDEIVAQNGELDSEYHRKEIYLWKYPGSDKCQSFQLQDYEPSYQSVYVDEQGRSWGCVGYYFGIKDKWICLDQPTADFDELYPEGIVKSGESVEISASEEKDMEASDSEHQSTESRETERIVPKMNYRIVVIAVIMVSAVVLATVALLIVIKKRHK